MQTALYQRSFLAVVLSLALAHHARAQRVCDDRAAASAAGAWSAPLDARISLHQRDISLRDALDRISAVSRVQIAYSADVIPVDSRVCVNADNAAIGAVLANVLGGLRVQVLVIAGRVVLAPSSASAREPAGAARVNVLERVVVTGNAVGTPRRPLPIGIEIIDGEQLRRQALGSLSDLLNAAVPGMWSWSQSPSSLVAQYGGIRGASSFGATYPKIYVDGVEVANPLVVTQLNPEIIDRVEVIRGPQGSALYGSDAISGVINILTRHDGGGSASPQISLHSTAGASTSDYSAALVPTHTQSISARGGTNIKSAGLAATYSRMGALYPSADSRQVSATGDARVVGSIATFSATARLFEKTAGIGRNPLFETFLAQPQQVPRNQDGNGPSTNASPLQNDTRQSVRQYTLSSNISASTNGMWTHTLLAGVDGYVLKHIADGIGPFPIAVDSSLRAAAGNGDRYTIRASSVAKVGEEGSAEGTLTFGVEQSVLRQESSVTMRVPPMQGQQYGTAWEGMIESWNHDTGILSQFSAAWRNSVFLSGGLRVERNDNFSGSNRYPLLPMIGVAVVRGYGEAEVKWRAAYGKGIRPPQTPARSSANGYTTGGLATSGIGSTLPALDPEVQSGYEGGVELYMGRSATIQLTRFDQIASGLIQYVATGVDTFARAGSYDRRVRYQLQNVGEITNTGWELQGNLSRGSFTLASSLSSVESRVRKLAFGYNGDLRAGDRMLAVPARTGALTASYLNSGWFVSIGATRAWNWINYDRMSLAQAFTTPGGGSRELTGPGLRSFWKQYDGEAHLRLSASREVARGLALQLNGENLLGGQLGEPDNVTIRAGRTLTAGLRASF